MDAIISTGKIARREYGIIAERNTLISISDAINVGLYIWVREIGLKSKEFMKLE
jgi:hypothetical protein